MASPWKVAWRAVTPSMQQFKSSKCQSTQAGCGTAWDIYVLWEYYSNVLSNKVIFEPSPSAVSACYCLSQCSKNQVIYTLLSQLLKFSLPQAVKFSKKLTASKHFLLYCIYLIFTPYYQGIQALEFWSREWSTWKNTISFWLFSLEAAALPPLKFWNTHKVFTYF